MASAAYALSTIETPRDGAPGSATKNSEATILYFARSLLSTKAVINRRIRIPPDEAGCRSKAEGKNCRNNNYKQNANRKVSLMMR